MKKKYFRNMLYVPAYKENYITKALESKADALIIDLEDSVPSSFKAAARENVKEHIRKGDFKNKNVFVRLNSLQSGLVLEDLYYACDKDVRGFVVTKIDSEKDIIFYDTLLSQIEAQKKIEEGHFKMAPLIETTNAFVNIHTIAKSSLRIEALLFGGEDFLSDLGGNHDKTKYALNYPRMSLAVAAKSAGILAIDTPYLEVHNLEGFLKEEEKSLTMGYDGVQLLSPSQIEPSKKCFTPNSEELEKAKRIMSECEKAEKTGKSVAMLDGKMIGPPMKKRAKYIIDKMDSLEL